MADANATAKEKETGMLEEYMLAIAETSISNDMPIIFRPINPAVFQRFKEGAVGKGSDIKAKSAEGGPLDGLIPAEAELSKLGNKLPENPRGGTNCLDRLAT